MMLADVLRGDPLSYRSITFENATEQRADDVFSIFR